MHRIDFRYFALRQTANILVIAYLGVVQFLKPRLYRAILLASFSGCIALIFLPAAVCVGVLSIALLAESRAKDERRRLFRDFAIAAAITAVALGLWAMIPGSLEQAVWAHVERPGETRLGRIIKMMHSREDQFLYGVGFLGLLLESVLPIAKSRPLALALLVMFFVNVLVPTNYISYYNSGAGIAFAAGAFFLVIRIRTYLEEVWWGRRAAALVIIGLIFIQGSVSFPALLKEWTDYQRPDFHAVAALVRRLPEPLLTLPAILGAEANRQLVRELTHYYIYPPPTPLPPPGDPLFESAASKACTIVLTPYLSRKISAALKDRWLSGYEVVQRGPWGPILLTHNPHCSTPRLHSVRMGEVIVFTNRGNGADYMLHGWSTPEDWGAWTDGSKADLDFKLQFDQRKVGDILLILDGQAFVSPEHPRLSIAVLGNGHNLALWQVHFKAQNGELVATVPRALIEEDGHLRVTFLIDKPVSFKELGMGDDGRKLGLGLRKISFVWAEAHQRSARQKGKLSEGG